LIFHNWVERLLTMIAGEIRAPTSWFAPSFDDGSRHNEGASQAVVVTAKHCGIRTCDKNDQLQCRSLGFVCYSFRVRLPSLSFAWASFRWRFEAFSSVLDVAS
jgi:hypothetical protein